MKNFLFVIVALLAIFVVGCSPRVEQKDIKISMQKDTLVSYKEAVTAPLYNCEGKKSCYEKVIGWEERFIPVSICLDTAISKEALANHGYNEAGNESWSSELDWLWPILMFFLGISLFLLAILLVALLLWGIIHLIRWLFRKKPAPAAPVTPASEPVAPVPPVTPPVPPAGSGPIYYIGHVENLHIHNSTPPTPTKPAPKKPSGGKK
jgi:hypothetical protein